MSIRKATIADFEGLISLNETIFVDNPQFDDDLIDGFMQTTKGQIYLKNALEDSSSIFIVAEENEKFIGYANGMPMEIPYRKSKYFEIENLGVTPDQKGSGLANKLLGAITQEAKEAGYEKIYLECYAKNARALSFYRKHGFEDIDVCLEKTI